jgi:hypothetical protein
MIRQAKNEFQVKIGIQKDFIRIDNKNDFRSGQMVALTQYIHEFAYMCLQYITIPEEIKLGNPRFLASASGLIIHQNQPRTQFMEGLFTFHYNAKNN